MSPIDEAEIRAEAIAVGLVAADRLASLLLHNAEVGPRPGLKVGCCCFAKSFGIIGLSRRGLLSHIPNRSYLMIDPAAIIQHSNRSPDAAVMRSGQLWHRQTTKRSHYLGGCS